MLHYLIYTSRAKTPMATSDLLALLKVARSCNESLGLTGMLLYINTHSDLYQCGNFIQFLEGEKSTVLKIYEKIKVDNRHENMILLNEGWLKERNFSDWRMGFESISAANLTEQLGYVQLNDKLFENLDFEKFNFALNLMKTFYDLRSTISFSGGSQF